MGAHQDLRAHRSGGPDLRARRSWWRVAGLVVLGGVVAWPAVQSDPSDGFPISSYPMFARDRGRVAELATVVGLTAGGEERRLGPQAIGGGDEVMLAASAARRAVLAGPDEARRFCREVAGRVAGGDGPDDVRRLEVRTERRDAVADPRAEAPALDVEVHASCPVR